VERSFVEALRIGDRARLVQLPKGDRHCHSILGASLNSIIAWTGKQITPPPSRMDGMPGMRLYTRPILYPHIRTWQGFEFTADTALREAVADGVTILEMSLDSALSALYPRGLVSFLDFVHRTVARYAPDIDFRPEIGISKRPEVAPHIAIALECAESALFKSVDLYGSEDAQEPEAYTELYSRCRRMGMKLKAHVGEFGDARLVERTWRALDLDEIQHGVAAASSPTLMGKLRAAGVRLNVCPSSNVALGVASDLGNHPIRTLARNGLRVTVNSDDKTVFARTVTDEYVALFEAGTLDAEELEEIRVESLRS
jgi:adenosine deaminase